MILALDVGNSQIFGGLFQGDEIRFRFRKTSRSGASSDEIGLFLRSVLRENGIDPKAVEEIALCSVVPDVVPTVKNACKKYFKKDPFVLQAGVRTGLKVKYRNPVEVGADRIANAIAGTHLFPGKNLLIADLGTATTYDVVTADKEYLGGSIAPGLRIAMESLESQTAKLPPVEIIAPSESLGRSTVESIQSGLYFGHLGMLRELKQRLSKECFKSEYITIGTGGISGLFENEEIFDYILPDLVLKGLFFAHRMNQHATESTQV